MILDAKLRKFILSFPFAREITNFIVNMNNKNFYRKINNKMHYDQKIKKFKDIKKGKRCFIVGNGPSLTIEQLDLIKGEDSFAANRIYKIFKDTTWRPSYYVIQDKYDNTKGVYEKLDIKNLFVSDFYWREHGMDNDNAICYNTRRSLKQISDIPFSEDCSLFIQSASTVTYTMIQLACYMGYSDIYLIGMDHKYSNITDDKGRIIKKYNINNHIFKDEDPSNVVANISYMDYAYMRAKKYCELNNINIFNATIGGHLEIFKRIEFFKIDL